MKHEMTTTIAAEDEDSTAMIVIISYLKSAVLIYDYFMYSLSVLVLCRV